MGVGATWSTWGARWFERAGVRTFGAASHSTDHWNSISLFSRGRDAHLPSSSPPRRARPTREWGRQTALRPEKALGYLIAKKKGPKRQVWGSRTPNWCLEIFENYDTGKQSEKVRRNFTPSRPEEVVIPKLSPYVRIMVKVLESHFTITHLDLASVVARITPPRLAPRGPNLGRASRGATRAATGTRCKRRFSSTAKPRTRRSRREPPRDPARSPPSRAFAEEWTLRPNSSSSR